ncbi:ankyrin repeat domain-containing protein 26 [Biomphalaria glabrata]|nr:ankyrin repeat domain-containing protein 26 [Biomphalaria glabrata]
MAKHQLDIFVAIATEAFDRLQRIVTTIPDINVRDSRMRTPLIASMVITDKTVLLNSVRLLLRHGSDVNAQDQHGRSTLMLACVDKERLDVLDLLVKNQSCDLNLKDCDGNTALHHAVESGNAMAIRVLVSAASDKRKLNLNEINNAGLSAYKLAGRLQHVRCSRMLVKHGGSELITNDEESSAKKPSDIPNDLISVRKRSKSRAAENRTRESIQSMVNEQRAKTPYDLSARSIKAPKYFQSGKTPTEISLRPDKCLQDTSKSNEFPQQVTERRGLPKLRPKSEVLPVAAFENPPYRPFHRPLSDRRVVTLSRDNLTDTTENRREPREGAFHLSLDESSQVLNLSSSNFSGYARPSTRHVSGATTLDEQRQFRLEGFPPSNEIGNSHHALRQDISPIRDFSSHEDRPRYNTRRVLTPIASAKTVYEDLRPLSPAPERVRDRLPSIASGKTLYLMTPREAQSRLY